MADLTPDLSSVVAAWEAAVEDARRAKEYREQARSESSKAECTLSNALEAERKAFGALLQFRPEAKP